MPLDASYIRDLTFPVVEACIAPRDAIFYALSIGLCRDPCDTAELRYVYERALRVFPTMAMVLGTSDAILRDPLAGITAATLVHSGQRLWTEAEMPIGEPLEIRSRVTEIIDKSEKGAIITIERSVALKAGGAVIARTQSDAFCRSDGGFGGPTRSHQVFTPAPSRDPDHIEIVPTAASMALLYRLNQDMNPLHADPAFAARAGFPRPILHGAATFAMAAIAILRVFHAPPCFIEARFIGPVFPGETLAVDLYDEGRDIGFQVRVVERAQIVVGDGRARLDRSADRII